MVSTPAEALPRAGFWARCAAWSLDAACLLPLIALLGASRMAHAFAEAGAALHVLAGAIPRLLGDALGGMQVAPIEMARQLLTDPTLVAASERLQGAIGAIKGITMALAPIPMTELFGYFTSDAAPVRFAGAPFLLSAVLMGVALVVIGMDRRVRQAS